MKLLFASSEAYPLLKTGGLGDVAHALPNALHRLGVDVRIVLPAYRELLRAIGDVKILGWIHPMSQDVRIFEARHPEFSMPLWLVDCPRHFDRPGNPYTHPDGYDWEDNPARFTLFSQAASMLANDALGLGWHADVVHANDWQTALIPAFLAQEGSPAKRIFTIHNIAYDCQFDYGVFQQLRLPQYWWSMEHAEFYHRFSMLKAGLVFSDAITTVSPRYAEEICTPEYGYGYADILRAQRNKLSGIINGIDLSVWDPQHDPLLAANYGPGSRSIRQAKQKNRVALLEALHVPAHIIQQEVPLIGFVGRLAYQKGIDLLLDAIPQVLAQHKAQFVLIGSGEAELSARLRALAEHYPDQAFIYIGYSERFAHLLEAGSDMFAMPSRYEPCGLNQLYSLRYGTPPIVRNTGGLADTVVDANATNLKDGTASGILFDHPDSSDLAAAISRAIDLYQDQKSWNRLIKTGMTQDLSWEKSAALYLELYRHTG